MRDHGGNLDGAIKAFGGDRADWIDLSTGINTVPYPVGPISPEAWTRLPEGSALGALEDAARRAYGASCAVVPVSGAQAAIQLVPRLIAPGQAAILSPTYNEHAASFAAAGWQITNNTAQACVLVNPNNPDGRLWQASDLQGDLRVIDESFCDVTPEATLMSQAAHPGTLILKSFGKFWGLAGMRLGFVMGDPILVERLSGFLGPWPVAGPALHIGATALEDHQWADQMRTSLTADAAKLDSLMIKANAKIVGGTPLFRLYDVADAAAWQVRLARHHIWSRVFPYNARWLRLGLPDPAGWSRLENALT